nr:thrombospondin-2 isoform X1 [Crassostrea gigas]
MMTPFCCLIVLGLLDMVFIPAVSGIVCMSDVRCRNMMNVAPDEEAYCQFNFFGVGCCHVRKRPAHWTAWSRWGHCSVTCGSGTSSSTRTCTGSGSCSGSSLKTKTCHAYPYYCPVTVDGYFEDWNEWSSCLQTCGSGYRTRSRACIPPKNGGAPCSQNNRETQQCVLKHCPVDGYLEDWSNWSTCSQTCGSGLRTRSRACKPPQYGGAHCSQNDRETQQCMLKPCPGLSCPECDAELNCVRNRTCSPGEVCMVRNRPFNVNCVKKHDCTLQKNTPGAEIECCEDDQCVTNILP